MSVRQPFRFSVPTSPEIHSTLQPILWIVYNLCTLFFIYSSADEVDIIYVLFSLKLFRRRLPQQKKSPCISHNDFREFLESIHKHFFAYFSRGLLNKGREKGVVFQGLRQNKKFFNWAKWNSQAFGQYSWNVLWLMEAEVKRKSVCLYGFMLLWLCLKRESLGFSEGILY